MVAGIVLTGLLGLLVGSFLNVVIWRVPRGESVVSPPSACPRCGHRIRPRDNVPVLGWLLLRGRCRDCAEPIPVRYPLVEAGTGVLFALACGWTVARGTPWLLPAALYLAAIGVALTLIDLDTRRLPDAIVLPSYPVLLALLAVASWGGDDWGALLRAVLAGAALAVFYFLVLLVYPAGMGLGDVKLAGVLGMALGWIGWGALLIGWFATFLLGGLFALALVVLGRAGRRTAIPFGPWMLGGAAIGMVAGPAVWEQYLGVFG
ncbi:prepilin peptidase [Cellulomonas denverensis]|uniref:Prepilin leader peptidase/N-methyltransferase n=1 Tax=Cellulomonas denverensis TaxID=264297 RepID=A0A7X6KTM2_9CELL|nr:A24 family peptidase [Cellulomonas denverensis]NKY21870.1 prepilin peptidase [Cellulomonas denverensis]GIG24240.1 prepilin peptidase [Cellulomonas denverensis]